MSVSKKKIASYLLLVFLLVVGSVGYLVYSQLTDLDRLKDILAREIGEITRSEVSVGGVELNFDQGIGITLKDVLLRKSSGGESEVSAQEILVVIKFLPLLARKVMIKKIVMRGSSIKLTRGADGKFDFVGIDGLLARAAAAENSFFKFVKMWFMPQLIIQDGKVLFYDYYERPGQDPIPIENIQFSIKKALVKSPFRFSLHGEILHPQGKTLLDISGELQNPPGSFDFSRLSLKGQIHVRDLFLSQFRPYVEKVFAFNPDNIAISLESRFSIGLDEPMRFAGNIKYNLYGEKDLLAFVDASRPYRGIMDYKISLHQGTLDVSEASFQFGKFHLQGNGRLTQLASPNPGIVFAIKSNELLVDELPGRFPFKALPEKLQQQVRRTIKRGTVEIRSLKFDGTLEQLLEVPRSLFSGEVALKNVNWNLPSMEFKKFTGTLRFDSGETSVKIEKARPKDFPFVNLKGEIRNLTGQPMANLAVSGNLALSQLKRILKTSATDPALRQMLDLYKDVSGTVKVRADLKGLLGDLDRLSIKGGFSIENAGLKKRGSIYPVKNLKGEVQLYHPAEKTSPGKTKTAGSWQIRFQNLSGDFGKNHFSALQGELLLGHGEPFFKSSGKFRLRAVDAVRLLPKGLVEAGHPYSKEVEILGGMLLVDYQGEGNPLTPKTMKFSIGLTLNEVSLKFGKDLASWRNLSGQVDFSQNRIRFKEIQGRYGDSPFKLNGRLTHRPKSAPEFDFRVTSSGFSANDLQGIPVLEELAIQGPMQFDIRWSGNPQSVRFQSSVDLSKAFYTYGDSFVKNAGEPNTMRLDGRISGKESVTIEKLVYELGENKIEGDGTVRIAEKPEFSLRILARDLQTFPLARNLSLLKNNRSGKVSFDIKTKGSLDDLDAVTFKGDMDFKSLVFKPRGYDGPLVLSAKVKFLRKKLNIRNGEFAFAGSRFRFKGGYSWARRPVFDLAISGKKLDLNQVFPNEAISLVGLRALLDESKLFTQSTGKLVFSLDHLDFMFWRMKKVVGELALKNKILWLDKLEITFPNKNRIRLRGLLAPAKSRGLRFKTQIQAVNIEANDFLGQFGEIFENGLSGKIKRLKINFECQGASKKEMVNSLKGALSFDLFSGRIDTKQLKAGVLRLFGPAQKAHPAGESKPPSSYERIAGDFFITRGVGRTENFVYETDGRKTSLVGTFDLNRHRMDAMVGVAFLPALDEFLVKIPIVGRIITAGDEESLVKNYYSVRGPFASPKITSVPFTSLGKKVIGIFQGILQTPRDILSLP